jgi:hypothetical protein
MARSGCGAGCTIVTRSVSEANFVRRPRLRVGFRWGHEEFGIVPVYAPELPSSART